ncbi:MAG TPA: periplasmic heavy metal sensor [Rhizomicrobium sp.]|nr:periplasmic heavy metal sensor [Rhizomicrobium sp.]
MEQPKPSRVRTTLLVMSLCLNVGLIGLILVGLGRVGTGFIAQPGVMAPAQIARGLPPEQRGKILDIVAEHRDAMREKREAARRARLEAFRAFAASTYVPGDFAQALERVRAADAALEEEAVAMQRDVINVLTPEERARIAERVRERRGAARPWLRRVMRGDGAEPRP